MNGLSEEEYAALAAEVHAERGECPSGAAGLAHWLDIAYRRGNGDEQDLSGADFDQASCMPRRSVVLAATYRSGSTLLAETLVDAGGYGWPLEYFQVGARHKRFQRFAGPDYVDDVLTHRSTAAGVFGVKLFPADLRDEPELWDRLPNPFIIRVRRRDRVAQAVSAWRALNGGQWRETRGQTVAPPTDYDYARLRALVGLFAWEDMWWGNRVRADVVTVWYEDLSEQYSATVDGLLGQLSSAGLPSDRMPGAPRLHRQADHASQQLAERFVADFRGVST